MMTLEEAWVEVLPWLRDDPDMGTPLEVQDPLCYAKAAVRVYGHAVLDEAENGLGFFIHGSKEWAAEYEKQQAAIDVLGAKEEPHAT